MGHAALQGHAPGAGSSTQRPAPAPHGRPGRSGSLLRRRATDNSDHAGPLDGTRLERFTQTDAQHLDPPPTRRPNRARVALGGQPAPAPPRGVRQPPLLRHQWLPDPPPARRADGRGKLPDLRVPPPGQLARSSRSPARAPAHARGAEGRRQAQPDRRSDARRAPASWMAGVDAAWISDPGSGNLVDRSPCAGRPSRAIIWSARRGRRNRSRDRRKAAGLIAR